jgi:hypothetical protein
MRGSIRRWPAVCLTAVLATMLSACHGGGTATGSSVLPQTPQGGDAAFMPNSLGPINLAPGAIIGADDMFKPHDGDTKIGGRGNAVDKIPCDPTEYLSDYHVHMYLGIVYKGRQIAVPDAIGLKGPGPEQNGYISTAKCFYFIHTHDASGMIHIESSSSLPPSANVYTFKNILDVWGMKYSNTSFGPFKGQLHVFVGNPASLGETTVSKYTKFKHAGQLGTIPVKSHEVIWIEIGKPVTKGAGLPPVTFYTEY